MSAATWTCPTCPWSFRSSGHGGYEPFGGWIEDMQDIVAVAQENVGCNDSIYGGTVGFVDTKPFWITQANRRMRRAITFTTTPAPS